MNTDETTTDTIKTDKSTTIDKKPIETTVTGTTTVDTIEKTVKANTTATSEQKTKRLIYLGPNLLEKGLQTFKIRINIKPTKSIEHLIPHYVGFLTIIGRRIIRVQINKPKLCHTRIVPQHKGPGRVHLLPGLAIPRKLLG